MFVSYNSVGGVDAREEFIDSFVDRFFPTDETPITGPPASTVATGASETAASADGGIQSGPPLSAFTGAYRTTRISYTSFEKVAGLNTDFRVRQTDNGTLVTNLPGQGTTRWVRSAPTVFEEIGGDGRIAFRVEDGRASYVFFDAQPPQSFERIAWWETTVAQGGLLAAALLVVLSGVLGWPVAALWRRFRRWRVRRRRGASERARARANGRGAGDANADDRPRAARWLAGFAGLLGVGFLGGFLGLLLTDPFSILTIPTSLRVLLAVPSLVFVATLGVVAFAVLAWIDRYWGLVGRIHYALVAAALVVLVWQLSYWNLLAEFWL